MVARIFVFVAIMITCLSAHASTLSSVKSRGYLKCAVGIDTPGFSKIINGVRVGIDIDYCRAIAAAVLGSPSKVVFTPVDVAVRFPILSSGQVDLLARNTSTTLERNAALKFQFPAVNFIDGQGIMVRKALKVTAIRQLDGAQICVPNTGTEYNYLTSLAEYMRPLKISYTPVEYSTVADAVNAYRANRCDALTIDRAGLASVRLTMAKPADHLILSEIMTRQPISLVVRSDDMQWRDIVAAVHQALLIAEVHGITRANVNKPVHTATEARGLLGDRSQGPQLGLDKLYARRAIAAVGNYGEVYQRHFGPGSRLYLERAVNSLYSKGGLHFPAPLF